MDTLQSTLRFAKHFFFGTSLSRASGLLRDIAMAVFFGSSPKIAAFMVAYRLANLFRRLFGEGNLQSGVVPHFEEIRGRDPKAAFLFYRDAAFSFSVGIGGFVGVMTAFLWGIKDFLSPKGAEIVSLSLWMVPGLLFICLSALNTALLQCQKKYFAPALAPALFNGVWVLAAWIGWVFFPSDAMVILSMGVTVAFAAQWAATALQARFEWREHMSLREWFQPQIFPPSWRKILAPMGLGIIGAGAMQINSALDAIFALVADPSGPAYLWYAIRIEQLPLSLFAIALSGALLPPLSRSIQAGDLEGARALLRGSCQRAMFWIIPCSFALFALGAAGLNLLYGRGEFGSKDLLQTLFCLWGYGLGLIPAALTLLLTASFYAKKSYKMPTFASLFSVGFHILLNVVLVFVLQWGAVSIALATSLSAWINYAILAWGTEGIDFCSMMKIGCASLGAAMMTVGLGSWAGDPTLAIIQGAESLFLHGFWNQCGQMGMMGLFFACSFLGLSWAMGLFVYTIEEKSPEKNPGLSND